MSAWGIWLIWGLFWGSVVTVMVAIFKDANRRDRTAEAYREFQSWDDKDLEQLLMQYGPVAECDEGLQINLRVASEVLRKRREA